MDVARSSRRRRSGLLLSRRVLDLELARAVDSINGPVRHGRPGAPQQPVGDGRRHVAPPAAGAGAGARPPVLLGAGGGAFLARAAEYDDIGVPLLLHAN